MVGDDERQMLKQSPTSVAMLIFPTVLRKVKTKKMTDTKEKILITGASGFIGSFLVARGLELGFDVWAAVRKSSSRRYLQDPRIHFLELDFDDDDLLAAQLKQHVAEHGAFAHVLHAAGATKARSEAEFVRVNAEGTARLARQLLQTKALPASTGRFVFFSSLSVYGPVREEDNRPILESDEQMPDTAYGRSKQQAEQELAHIPDLNYIILRPTGVYGPREKDYFLMAKSIIQRVDFSVGYKPQTITFIYVRDLVEAAYLALSHGESGRAYFLTDGHNYSSRDFSNLLQKELNIRGVLHIKAPIWFLKLVCCINGGLANLFGKTTTLNMDKFNILKQRNWQCDIRPAEQELGYRPQYPLERGVKETVNWYIQNGWL